MKPLCNKCGTTHWETQACETAEQKEVRLGGAPFPVSPPAKASDPDPVLQAQPAPTAPVVTEQVNQTEVPQAPPTTPPPAPEPTAVVETVPVLGTKPKRTMTPEHKAKMKAAREAAAKKKK